MLSRLSSVIKRRNQGFTLVEIMVALVVSALAAIAIYGSFIGLSRIFTQTKSQNNTWQQARTAMAMLTQAVESAGYGLPLNLCTAGIYSTGLGVTSLVPVAAVAQVSPLYDPTATASVNTYSLTAMAGGGTFGSAAAAHVTSVPSTSSSDMTVDNSVLLAPSDIFLLTLSNSSCILGQITNINGNNQTNVVHNHGGSGSGTGSIYNAPRGFAGTDPGVTTAQLQNAGLVDLGQGGFYVDTFTIDDQNGAGVPSLYLTQYLYNTQTAPTASLVARGIVDMQIEFGYGQYGSVLQYLPPNSPGAPSPDTIVAVKIALLARSTRTVPGLSPTSIPLMGVGTASVISYTVPTGLPATANMGCVSGNCRHYLYHVFKTVIPVRNVIWSQ